MNLLKTSQIVRFSILFVLFVLLSNNTLAFQSRVVPFSWDKIEDEFLVRNFTTQDGLPVNAINRIIPHPNGYLYITTFDGLLQFDGNRFVSYTTTDTPELKSNRLDFSLLDGENGLWIIDVLGNLYLFRDGHIESFQDNITEKEVTVYHSVVDGSGNLWVSTNVGLYHQKTGMDFVRIKGTETLGRILGLDSHDHFGINILTDEGLFVVREGQTIERIPKEELPIAPIDVFSIESINNGALWLIGKNKELFFVDTDDNIKELDYPAKNGFAVNTILSENDTSLLAITSRGYKRIDKKTFEFSETAIEFSNMDYFGHEQLFTKDGGFVQIMGNQLFIDEKLVVSIDNQILNLAIDTEGSIWLATSLGGLYQVTKKNMYTVGTAVDPSLRGIYSVIEDTNKDIWLASFHSGLGISKISPSTFTNWEEEFKEDRFNTLIQTNSGSILVGGLGGLYKYENDSWSNVPIDLYNILSLYEDAKNNLWVGTLDDAYYVNRTNYNYTSFEDSYDVRLGRVNAIKQLQDNELAFLTSGKGVVLLDETDQIRILDKKLGLSSDQVRDLYQASADTLWVVTEDFGLNRLIFDQSKNVTDIKFASTRDGLIDNSLHRLIRDDFGFFWINSNKGIMRINEKELNAYLDEAIPSLTVQSFTQEDGLDHIEGNGGVQNAGILTTDGKLLFPNQAGIIYTHPEWHLNTSQVQLPLPRAEEVRFADSQVSLQGKEQFELPKSIRDFQIKFTLPTFSSPDKLILEYKLDDINETWHRVGAERLAVFTNVSGGNKTFLMRGKFVDDQGYSESQFNIFIPPLYYETFAFKLFLGFCFLLALALSGWISGKRSKQRETQLEAVVQHRTKELMDRTSELEQSRAEVELSLKQIQQLDESKSRFFTNFTHELRTPLSLILNPLEDMLEKNHEVNTDTSVKNLVLMKRNAERLKDLVNQLLDVSKLNSGEFSLTIELLPLFDITKQISSQFEHAIQKKEIQLSIENKLAENSIYMDRKAWEHICINLIGNAIKFTPVKGKISILLSEDKNNFIFSVKDTGVGISAVDTPFIFDAYYQGGSSISKSQGTGIGLSLVKGFVERMKGKIEVQSKEGEGTEFIIHLQKGYAHFDKKDRVIYAKDAVENNPSSSSNLELDQPPQEQPSAFSSSILLVEDNDDFREYIHSVISDLYTVQVATNGKEGLETLKNFKPDIIVSDIMMPEMDGYEMMRAIRAMEAYKHIPFIFLSAKDSEVDIETGLNSGADIYLTKPVQNKLLLTQIRALLRREKYLRESIANSRHEVSSPFVHQVLEIIQRHLGNPDLNINLILGALSMSKATLYRKWKEEKEETLNQTITQLRLTEAIRLIREENLNFSEAAYAVGYNNLSYFSQSFKKTYGMSPQEYLKTEFG